MGDGGEKEEGGDGGRHHQVQDGQRRHPLRARTGVQDGGPLEAAPSLGKWLALPITAAALSLGSYGLVPLIRRTRHFNLPTATPITEFRPEDQARIRHLTARYLLWMNAILIGGLWLLQIHQRAAGQ